MPADQFGKHTVTGTLALLERVLIQLEQQFADGSVQLHQGEELTMPERR
jgi:hypothetical protein